MATVVRSRFELLGADGGPLRGDVRTAGRGEGRPAIVVCHGFKGFKDWGMFPHLCERLARAGFTAVSFNFSGSGVGPDGESFSETERFARDTYSAQLADLETVCRALQQGELPNAGMPAKLGLFGHSRGGGIAVLHASRSNVAALVTWSAVSNSWRWSGETITQWRAEGVLHVVNSRTGDVLPMSTAILEDLEADTERRLDIRAAAGRIEMPWLIVHGETDESVPVSEARALHDAATAGSSVKIEIVPNAGHTFGARHPWQGTTPELNKAMEVTAGWFSRYLC